MVKKIFRVSVLCFYAMLVTVTSDLVGCDNCLSDPAVMYALGRVPRETTENRPAVPYGPFDSVQVNNHHEYTGTLVGDHHLMGELPDYAQPLIEETEPVPSRWSGRTLAFVGHVIPRALETALLVAAAIQFEQLVGDFPFDMVCRMPRYREAESMSLPIAGTIMSAFNTFWEYGWTVKAKNYSFLSSASIKNLAIGLIKTASITTATVLLNETYGCTFEETIAFWTATGFSTVNLYRSLRAFCH